MRAYCPAGLALASAISLTTTLAACEDPRFFGATDPPAARTLNLTARPAEAQIARGERPAVKRAIMGALLYLDDTQIRERPGWHHPRHDACSGDGCLKVLPGKKNGAPLPLPFTSNLKGEWASQINIFPDKLSLLTNDNQSLIQIQDSNRFMSAAIAYTLYLIDEAALPPAARIVTQMRRAAQENIRVFRRGTAYNFWPQLKGLTSPQPRVGPLNIPMVFGNLSRIMQIIPASWMAGKELQLQWKRDAMDSEINPYGMDALANIPNDADDTAVAYGAQVLHHLLDNGPAADPAILDALAKWRDLGRSKDDGRDVWRGRDTGAYMTWLKDETLPREQQFKDPASGVMPLGVNNVDCVVNANVLWAMGLAGRQGEPAVLAASTLMQQAVERHAWPQCGLYYPQEMIFPYTLTRAYREGRLHNPPMEAAIKRLLVDLLAAQGTVARSDPDKKGAFPGGSDPTYELATALAVNALLNIGGQIADQVGLRLQYDEAITDGIDFLLRQQRTHRIQFGDTFDREQRHFAFPSVFDTASVWSPGLYFSASSWSLAQWRSEPYTTAIVLEALLKYVLEYDRPGVDIRQGRRLKVNRYARNARQAEKDFAFQIKESGPHNAP